LAAVQGAIVFGYFTDEMGRKLLFLVTLARYTVCTVLTAFMTNFFSVAALRFLTAMAVEATCVPPTGVVSA
jgi:putative MFS transporter